MALTKETAKALLTALVAAMNECAGKSDDDDPDEKSKKDKKDKKKSYDEDDVKEKFVEFVEENGKPAAKKLLKKFSIEKLSELEEDDYAKFVKACGGDADDDDGDGDKKSKKDKDDLFGDD